MKPILSNSGHATLSEPGMIRRGNAALQQAIEAMGPLTMCGLSFSWRMIHLGQGAYARGDSFGFHAHDHLHVESVLSGRFRFGFESGSVRLNPGQTLFVMPRSRHDWECVENGYMMGGLINVMGPAQGDLFAAIREQWSGAVAVSPAAGAVWYGELMKLLTASDPTVFDRPAIASLLELLLIDFANSLTDLTPWQSAETTDVESDDRAHDLCRHAMEFLEASYAHPIQVEDVARQAGISARHLTRLFRQTYGDSVTHVLNQIRLRRAHEMLQEKSDLSIKQIAFATGFSSPAYFTACFKKEFGLRPGDVRK